MKHLLLLLVSLADFGFASDRTPNCPGDYKHVAPAVEKPATTRTTSYLALLEMLAASGVRAEPLAVGKVTRTTNDVPFGKFKFNDVEYDYANAPAEAKKLDKDSHEIFFGRKASSLDDARTIVARYFTQGVERTLNGAHFDIARHQGDAGQPSANGKKIVYDSATSGFSNGSEAFEESRYFASQTPVGVVFVMDTQGQEVLNLTPWHKDKFGNGSNYAPEQEILTKGGRSPKRVRAAVIFENGKPVALYTNPNFQPRGGK